MSRESIRKKIEEAKAHAKLSLQSKDISPEVKLSIESLMLVIDILVVVFLDKIRKNSSNSGLPPSKNFGSNGNRNKDQNSDDTPKGDQCPNTKETLEKERVKVDSCKSCGVDLASVECLCTETRREIDINYEVVTTEVTVETKECPECGELTKGSFPLGMDGPLQYGIGIKAAIIYLYK